MTKFEHFLERSEKWIDSHPYLADTIIIITIPTVTLASIYYFGPTSGWRERNAWIAASYFSILTIVTTLLSLRHKKSLFLAIAFWTLLSVACYTALSWLWGGRFLAGWTNEKSLTFKELLTTTLAAVGGIGAVGYLVIKYREQASTEREEVRQNEGEADKQLTAAVKQLGSKSPQVRIAGVYALADVADTYEGPYHQRVVDILCGYLRTDRLLRDTNGNTRYATNEDGTPNYNHPLSADGPVESTILSVLANHLRSSPTGEEKHSTPGTWSSCHIDIHNAHLTEKLRFNNTHITTINAQGTAFVGDVVFSAATFMQDANFDGTSFMNNASFWKVTFMQEADFRGATFQQDANFFAANLQQAATFYHSIFAGTTEFKFTKFPASTSFKDAIFNINQQDSGHAIFKSDDIHLTQYGIPAESKWSHFENGKPSL